MTREQELWRALLHIGPRGLLAGPSALEVHGLRGWRRDQVASVLPSDTRCNPVEGVSIRRSGKHFRAVRRQGLVLQSLEDASIWWATTLPPRTARGLLAACVQQQLTTFERLSHRWRELGPLPNSKVIGTALQLVGQGAQSAAEMDVDQLCVDFCLEQPHRQRARKDRHGRWRYLDCEWDLGDGRTLVLEVDGRFHMEVSQWESDKQRHRGLTDWNRLVISCTTAELREVPESIGAALIELGVPRRWH